MDKCSFLIPMAEAATADWAPIPPMALMGIPLACAAASVDRRASMAALIPVDPIAAPAPADKRRSIAAILAPASADNRLSIAAKLHDVDPNSLSALLQTVAIK